MPSMNGAGTRKLSEGVDYDDLYGTTASGHSYHGKLNGLTNPPGTLKQVNGNRYSTMLNPQDPVAMHLLMEHALGESQDYQVFSLEEIEELKKEKTHLSSRIEATRRKLIIEAKIRDAASSVSRLGVSGSREKPTDGASKQHRRNLLSKGSGTDILSNKSEDEIAASVRKCEDLTQELWELENRSQEVQKLLLEHTAGVLQITHRGSPETNGHKDTDLNGYLNNSGDSGLLNSHFDDRSFYQTLDAMLYSNGPEQDATTFTRQTQAILDIQQKLYDLNQNLRDAINDANPGGSIASMPPPLNTSDDADVEGALFGQVQYLERGLDSLQRKQADASEKSNRVEIAAEERLESLSHHLRNVVIRAGKDTETQVPQPPQVSGQGTDAQIAFLEGGLNAIEQDIQRLQSAAQTSHSRSLSHENRIGQYELTFETLWQKLVAEEEANRGTDETGEPSPRELFSLEAFTSKVNLLNSRATSLAQQKDILSRQIQQQREVNKKSDSEKDARLQSLGEELEMAKSTLEARDGDLHRQLASAKSAHAQVQQEMNESQTDLHAQLATATSSHAQLHQELQQHKEQQAELQQLAESKSAEAERALEELQELEGEVVRLQTELTVSRAELDGAYGTRAQRAAEVAQHPALMAEVAELKEELAAVKSNRDNSTRANAELSQHVQTLQKELSETISEYEVMTKSSIEFEKEREILESNIDSLRDKIESLETDLSDEKVNKLGVKSPGVAGDRNSNEKGATSTSVLRNEFKKMMRETRAENIRMLRHEQDERRKLEAQIRALRRDQTPGKSSLSQSMTAP